MATIVAQAEEIAIADTALIIAEMVVVALVRKVREAGINNLSRISNYSARKQIKPKTGAKTRAKVKVGMAAKFRARIRARIKAKAKTKARTKVRARDRPQSKNDE